jgi:hypothetical protein
VFEQWINGFYRTPTSWRSERERNHDDDDDDSYEEQSEL